MLRACSAQLGSIGGEDKPLHKEKRTFHIKIGEDETLQTDRRDPWKIGGEDKMLQRDKQTDTTLRGSQLWSKNVMTSSFWEGQLLQSLDV